MPRYANRHSCFLYIYVQQAYAEATAEATGRPGRRTPPNAADEGGASIEHTVLAGAVVGVAVLVFVFVLAIHRYTRRQSTARSGSDPAPQRPSPTHLTHPTRPNLSMRRQRIA